MIEEIVNAVESEIGVESLLEGAILAILMIAAVVWVFA